MPRLAAASPAADGMFPGAQPWPPLLLFVEMRRLSCASISSTSRQNTVEHPIQGSGMDIPVMLREIQEKKKLTTGGLAVALGTSFASVNRWLQGTAQPSPAQVHTIEELHKSLATASWSDTLPKGNDFSFRAIIANHLGQTT